MVGELKEPGAVTERKIANEDKRQWGTNYVGFCHSMSSE